MKDLADNPIDRRLTRRARLLSPRAAIWAAFMVGLAIVARIVHKLKGEVEIDGEVGRGSTFWVKLPAVEP